MPLGLPTRNDLLSSPILTHQRPAQLCPRATCAIAARPSNVAAAVQVEPDAGPAGACNGTRWPMRSCSTRNRPCVSLPRGQSNKGADAETSSCSKLRLGARSRRLVIEPRRLGLNSTGA
jgi:hypothetical protein